MVGVFLDRLSDLKDYALAREISQNVYSDSVYLPFRASTLRPQRWREQRVILALECEPVFSEVMATRWLVDAFERSAYILSVSSRYETTSAKATERILTKPPSAVRLLEELADRLEGKERDYRFGDKVERLAKAFSLVKESLILIGESLLRSPWRGNLLDALRRIRRKLKVNYSFVGNVSPLPAGEIGDFKRDLLKLDALIIFGNPALYLSDEELEEMSSKKILSFEIFPNLTAHHSDVVLPYALFPEREFVGYKNGFGFVFYSPKTLSRPEGAYLPEEILGLEPEAGKYLSSLGVDAERLKESEGGEDIDMPYIEDWDGEVEVADLEEEELYLLCDNTLVDELGHWNVWTHEIERRQAAHMSERTAQELKVESRISLGDAELEVKINNNVADGVVFVPNSFEEMQPFDPGVRAGRIMKDAAHRIEILRLK